MYNKQKLVKSNWVVAALLILFLISPLTTHLSAATVCGDANGDDMANIVDASFLINYIFFQGSAPDPECAADVNNDASVNIVDASAIINYIFFGGNSPNCPETCGAEAPLTYPIVDTDQKQFYNTQNVISPPALGDTYYGQDAQFDGYQMNYTISPDSLTVYDNVTGLTWTRSPDLNGDGTIDIDDKLTFSEALDYPDTLNAKNFGGFDDWRMPSMKELYSLMNFSGTDPSAPGSPDPIPYIDTAYFKFGYGDESAGERIIDAQFWSTNQYIYYVFDNQTGTFGLNLADGRIKCYPVSKLNYQYFVRGNTSYGINDFVDNSDGTISDKATGLMWSKDDSQTGLTWVEALTWVQQKNSENYLGYSDWRLPNAKEMQSLVDYTRAPDVTASAAIDPIFNITAISNEKGETGYPWFWTGTTHISANGDGVSAVYICFGRGMGYMNYHWTDVHGAGCQRSDRKDGNFSGYTYTPYGYYHAIAPQGDAVRLYNYVRLVRTEFGI